MGQEFKRTLINQVSKFPPQCLIEEKITTIEVVTADNVCLMYPQFTKHYSAKGVRLLEHCLLQVGVLKGILQEIPISLLVCHHKERILVVGHRVVVVTRF